MTALKTLLRRAFIIACIFPAVLYGADNVTSSLHFIGPRPTADTPVSFGIPFLQGELQADGVISLRGDSALIPSDSRPLAYWPDGSVKWMGVDAVIPQSADSISFTTVPHKKRAANLFVDDAVSIIETPAAITINTGKLQAYFSKQGSTLFDSLQLNAQTVATAATLHCSIQDSPSADAISLLHFADFYGKTDTVYVEQAGNIRALVHIDGHYAGEDGRNILPFTVRLYFYAGNEQIKMVHSFIFDADADADFIHSLGIRFKVPMREALYNRHVAFSTANGGLWAEPVQPLIGRRVLTLNGDNTLQQRQMNGERIPDYNTFDEKNKNLIDHWATWSSYRLNQSSPDAFIIRKRTHADRPWIGTFSGTRAPGFALAGDTSGGLAVCMNDFWQSFPTALQIDSADTDNALLTVWLWSPEAAPMDLRHYDNVAHDLEASYEDVQDSMSTPYGVARTHTLTLLPIPAYTGKTAIARLATRLTTQPQLLCTPQYLHDKHAFGIWSLPKYNTTNQTNVENRLNDFLTYYLHTIEEHKWYGFWNYGDFMHTYDPVRHTWRYDIGGYAWDNTELGTNMWLWYSFLRTGRHDLWTLAVAMTRHTAECDVYHLGPYAGLGSRHNVSHWGCGAKEARISQAAWNRFLYYLTTDERCGDLMHEVKDAEQMLYHIDPMRLALPRTQYPCTAPARLRVGPDWLAYAGNWMTEWERTRNTTYRNKIIAGMKSIAALPNGIFTGPGVLGFDPATGILSYEGDPNLQHTNHLLSIMGGFQVMNEMLEMLNIPEWNKAWLDYAIHYKQKAADITHNRFPVTRLIAYAAYKTANQDLADEAWNELWHAWNNDKPFTVNRIDVPEAPAPLLENPWICTNDAATWSLAAIYMQEVIPK